MTPRQEYEARKALQRARRDRARDKEEIGSEARVAAEHEAELARIRFFRHPDRIVRYSGWLQLYTFALFAATLLLFGAAGITAVILHNTDTATHELATAALKQAGAADKQAKALQGQLALVEANQRPWMKIQTLAPNVSPIDPRLGGLRYAGQNAVGFLPLHLLLKNVGNSPAFDVRVGVGQFFGYAQKIDDLAKEQETKCAALDNTVSQTPMVVDSTTFVRVICPVMKCHTIQSRSPYCRIKSINFPLATPENKSSNYGFMAASATLSPTQKNRIRPASHIGYRTL
jgi:hypothetical protein